MKEQFLKVLKRILDPVIALSTLSNIIAILVLLEILNRSQADTASKIGTLIITIFIQIGIMKTPKSKK
jgi:hypothetical protein